MLGFKTIEKSASLKSACFRTLESLWGQATCWDKKYDYILCGSVWTWGKIAPGDRRWLHPPKKNKTATLHCCPLLVQSIFGWRTLCTFIWVAEGVRKFWLDNMMMRALRQTITFSCTHCPLVCPLLELSLVLVFFFQQEVLESASLLLSVTGPPEALWLMWYRVLSQGYMLTEIKYVNLCRPDC